MKRIKKHIFGVSIETKDKENNCIISYREKQTVLECKTFFYFDKDS